MNQDYLKEQLEKMNEKTTLKEIQKYVNDMVEIRGFDQETPKDIMLLMTEEVGELAKEIRKMTPIKVEAGKRDVKRDLEGEIADVFIYLLCMCRVTNVDILEAFRKKEEKNAMRRWE